MSDGNEYDPEWRDKRYANPSWDEAGKVHDWRNHVPDEVRAIWGTFTPEQQVALGRLFDELAGQEKWE